MKESGNVFAAFTPVAWPTSLGAVADPSGRTCIVSLINAHDRPFRLKQQKGSLEYAISRDENDGPCFGGGYDVAIWTEDGTYCFSRSFVLDVEAESEAGLPPLLFAYDKTLLSGVGDGEGEARSCFSLAELECFTLDA